MVDGKELFGDMDVREGKTAEFRSVAEQRKGDRNNYPLSTIAMDEIIFHKPHQRIATSDKKEVPLCYIKVIGTVTVSTGRRANNSRDLDYLGPTMRRTPEKAFEANDRENLKVQSNICQRRLTSHHGFVHG